jgi:hypothetical protein
MKALEAIAQAEEALSKSGYPIQQPSLAILASAILVSNAITQAALVPYNLSSHPEQDPNL